MATPAPSAFIELLKPITWFAPMWAFACGVVSSGATPSGQWPVIAAGVILAGPLVCATSQAANDWFDRHVDAINEPNRPIPSGRIPGRWGLYIAAAWTVLSLGVAAVLGPWVLGAALFGLVLAWIYSAPPIRLKRNGWWGNAACGLCYEGLPWFTGAAVMAAAMPDRRVVVIALLYAVGAHGIMTLNDFKSIEGDRALGLRSIPVQMGAGNAALFACLVMALPQTLVVSLLLIWERTGYAAGIAVLLAGQLALMAYFLKAPRERAAWYNGTGTTLYVLGMLVAAFALRPIVQGGL
ncbi:chlorophyll synthase ChlG [Methylobacterium iners]|uniref:1,4-dihydroxy-2-naphthoate octaprenyltransferase n=1 Tax=Methylobacterium iners TaxID=418707 RepID=A0ABQ4RUZ4_9HYPH|nr:chlorophyll synthase ChlG [Methylobacterium iners]GJD94625.1 1,4-dihydroxy-2-naphthoate octaprenyltransferase [Methylobacterium iners]